MIASASVVGFDGLFRSSERSIHIAGIRNQGQLKASVVNLFDFSNGVGTSQARINPASSTGRFAGATGFLFFNGLATSSSPFTDHLEISGQICYAQ